MNGHAARDPQLLSILSRTEEFGRGAEVQASALSRVRADLDAFWIAARPGDEADLAWLVRPHGRLSHRRRAS